MSAVNFMSSAQILDVYLLTICLVVNYMSSGQVVGVGYLKRTSVLNHSTLECRDFSKSAPGS